MHVCAYVYVRACVVHVLSVCACVRLCNRRHDGDSDDQSPPRKRAGMYFSHAHVPSRCYIIPKHTHTH